MTTISLLQGQILQPVSLLPVSITYLVILSINYQLTDFTISVFNNNYAINFLLNLISVGSGSTESGKPVDTFVTMGTATNNSSTSLPPEDDSTSSNSPPTTSSDDNTPSSSPLSLPTATSNNDTTSPNSPPTTGSGSIYSPIGVWSALVAATVLVCITTVVVCCIAFKFRGSKKCTEEVNHSDHNSHGIYSDTGPNTTGRHPVLLTPPATDVPLRETEPYYSQPVIATDGPQDHLTANAAHNDQVDMTANVAYRAEMMEAEVKMTENVAYQMEMTEAEMEMTANVAYQMEMMANEPVEMTKNVAYL